jgi:hypothetical protein
MRNKIMNQPTNRQSQVAIDAAKPSMNNNTTNKPKEPTNKTENKKKKL